MKKVIYFLLLALLMTGPVFTGCRSSATKVEDASDKVDEANAQVAVAQNGLDQAIRDSVNQFKKESEAQIDAYDKNIAEFRVKIAKERKELRASDERRLAELEQQNREMKQRLAAFNAEKRDQWVSFRIKFNEDMERHGKAFRNFWKPRR